ncbi:MAG: DUF6320 domain-containing protein [Eubacteriales bacterium]|nr:DUF6320 domain-containing protein [Eubacteriales bacterium]
MQYCDHCQVSIRGNKKRCPLCKNVIAADDNDTEKIYPYIPLLYESHLVIRILIFITIVTIVVSFAVYRLIPSNINWPVFVLLGLLSVWLSIALVLRKRNNITKNIMWLVALASALSILWDWMIDWKGWSLDYVIPIVCVAAICSMYVTAKVMKLGARDYTIYFLLAGLFGIMPVLFIMFDWLNVLYPSIICVSVSIIFLSAIIIFQGSSIKSELNKKMHL